MRNAYVMLHVAVLLAGFTGVFGKLITLPEVPLVGYRVWLSAFFLWVLVTATRTPLLSSWKDKFHLGKLGILLTLHWIFFYASIKYSNVSIGVVCYCLTSFFTAILDPVLSRKSFDKTQLGLSILTLMGIGLIFSFDTSYQVGIGLGVVSSLLAALYTILNGRVVSRFQGKQMNYYQMIGGSSLMLVLVPLYAMFHPEVSLFPTVADAGYLSILALVCTVGLYLLFAEVLKTLSPFTVNLSFNLEPIYAIALAFVLFNEGHELAPPFYVGVGMVMVSVILQSFRPTTQVHS